MTALDSTAMMIVTFLLNALWEVTLVAGAALLIERRLARSPLPGPASHRHLLLLAAGMLCLFAPLASALRTSTGASIVAVTGVDAALPMVDAASMGGGGGDLRLMSTWMVPRAAAFAVLGLYAAFLLRRVTALVQALRRTRAMLRRARVASPLAPALAAAIEEARAAFGMSEVPVLVSDDITTPVTAGARRPRVLIPASLVPPAGRDHDVDMVCAIGHELAHVARGDYAWRMVQEVVLLPIAFHPLSRRLARRLDRTRELACDERVAGPLMSRRDYAGALLRLAERCLDSARAGATCALGVFDDERPSRGGRRSHVLEERVLRLLAPSAVAAPAGRRRSHLRLGAALTVVVAAGALSPLAACSGRVAPATPEPAVESPAPAPADSVASGNAARRTVAAVAGSPEDALQGAMDAYVRGDYVQAMALARTRPDSVKAQRVVGASACFLRDEVTAIEARAQLGRQPDETTARMDQKFLSYVCARNGIHLD